MDCPSQGPGDRSSPAILNRFLSLAAWCVLVAFIGATFLLARINNDPGSSDSCGNLILARSLHEGRGYVTGGLGELWIRRPLDTPDDTRPPGVPYLLAGIFAVAGVSLAVPVLLNGVTVCVTALALRAAIRRRGGRWAGDLALILVILSYDYEMISIWNNNLLTACTAFLLFAGSRRPEERPGLLASPAVLAACSAAGFLMKQTFVLTACPYAFLILGSNTAKSKSRRVAEIGLYVAILAGLTSVYWGRNLVNHGTLLHVPSFASARLAGRYGFLPHGTWRTVRFDHPATYGEVVRTLGLAQMLIVDAKTIAKTIFYSICLNPAVVLCGAGVLLFRQSARWLGYAEVVALCAGILFEVGIYNHHEFRYLWPMYPCLLLLAWFTLRDFAEWGRTQVTPLLASRFKTVSLLLGVSALLIGALGALENWRTAWGHARQPTPGWTAAVRSLPPETVVLTSDVGSVIWWSGKRAVVSPLGERSDLAAVVSYYKPGYYLALKEEERPGGVVAFKSSDLERVDQGKDWRLYRIVGPLLSVARP